MKKALKVIIGTVLLVCFGLFILNSCGEEETTEGAEFKMPGNIKTTYGKIIPIDISIPDGLTKAEVFYNDSLIKTYEGKKGNFTFQLEAHYYGLGTRTLILRSHFSDGTQQDASLIVKVISDVLPQMSKATIVNSYPHNTESYTQGLEFNNGQLYEGTGDPGQQGKSLLAKVDLNTGAFGTKVGLGSPNYFGEGITILGDKVYQLTWQSGECFVYDKNTLQLDKQSFRYNGEGWGLCNNGKQLIMSEGSEIIYFRNAKTFAIERTIHVYDNVSERRFLNELEYIDGKIYANVYGSDVILVIDPQNGKVLEEIDCSALVAQADPTGKLKTDGQVLNGIAYNPATKKLYLTGKYWNKVFEVTTKPSV